MSASISTLRYLAARVGVADHAAFRSLYAMLAPQTLTTIGSYQPDPAKSMHVLRGTFCEVWWMCAFDVRCRRARDDVASWVESIARRRCIELRRPPGLMSSDAPLTDLTGMLATLADDNDRWTQFQLASMLNGDDAVEPAASPAPRS